VSHPRILPAGDAAFIVSFEERIDAAVNAQAITLAGSFQARPFPGVLDVVPTFRSVAVYFDPVHTDIESLRARLEQDANAAGAVERSSVERVIPVEYGGPAGPDLADVARAVGLAESEVVAMHAGGIYRVFMLGFLPGFAYMGPIDVRLVRPRRSTPRPRVPAGSVAIAGAQTGVYPVESPGGWHIIGRTSVKLFDPGRHTPFLLEAGDTVRFSVV
jgi:inhibitor of KinA